MDEFKGKKLWILYCILITILYSIFVFIFFRNEDAGFILITIGFYLFNNILIRNKFYLNVSKKELDELDKKRDVFGKKMSDFNDILLMSFAIAYSLKQVLFNDNLVINGLWMLVFFVLIFLIACICIYLIFLRDENSYWYDEEYVKKLDEKKRKKRIKAIKKNC